MTTIELAEEIQNDFDRILEHLLEHQATDPIARIDGITRAIDILQHNPLIGRPTSDGLRELVIGRSTRGYIALYTYAEEIDTVFVLAIRSAIEAGYARNFLV